MMKCQSAPAFRPYIIMPIKAISKLLKTITFCLDECDICSASCSNMTSKLQFSVSFLSLAFLTIKTPSVLPSFLQKESTNNVGIHMPAPFMGCCGLTFCSVAVLLVVASLLPYSAAQQVKSERTLDLLVRDYTFMSYNRNFIKTGTVHSVSLPRNLSGIRADTVKYRCGSLRRYGARLKEFHLGVGVTVTPCTERVMVIRQFLEQNWSTVYYSNYDLSGYQLISPVLGLLAYNAGSPSEIGLSAGEIPITVNFSSPLTEALARQYQKPGIVPLCANFGADGKLTLSNMVALAPYLCLALRSGHFGLVMELPPVQGRRKESAWKVAIGSSIGTALGVFLLGLLLVALFVKAKKRSRREEMERRAYEEEALQVSMVGHVRAPTAAITRTVPGIEHGYAPSPP